MATSSESKRVVIEVSEESRAKLKIIAAIRRVTMRELIDDLATKAEQEALQSVSQTNEPQRQSV